MRGNSSFAADTLDERGHFVDPSSGRRLPSYAIAFVNFLGWPVCFIDYIFVIVLFSGQLKTYSTN